MSLKGIKWSCRHPCPFCLPCLLWPFIWQLVFFFARSDSLSVSAESAISWFLWWKQVRENPWPKEYEPIETLGWWILCGAGKAIWWCMMYDPIVSSRSFTIFAFFALWHYEYGPHLVGNSIFDICQPTFFKPKKKLPGSFSVSPWMSHPKNKQNRSLGYLRFIQEPGEIVFVPARWWHAVLNLEDVFGI